MSNPWDNPPLPSNGDVNIDAVFNGVGRVMTQWEGIEVGLSRIYSHFLFMPDDFPTIRKYGSGYKFRDRFADLEEVAERFFVAHPDQHLEGEFHQIGVYVVGFSDRRNDVAHGIVNPIQFYDWYKTRAAEIKPRTTYWALLPPYHTFRKHLANGEPAYAYTSKELLALEQQLIAIYGEISQYRGKLVMHGFPGAPR
jgi:hypothetical protein